MERTLTKMENFSAETRNLQTSDLQLALPQVSFLMSCDDFGSITTVGNGAAVHAKNEPKKKCDRFPKGESNV